MRRIVSLVAEAEGVHAWGFLQMPVIEHNAQLIPDSGFIIEYLSNTFPEQIIKLTPEQQALSTVVTYFCDKHWSLQIPYNRFVDSQV